MKTSRTIRVLVFTMYEHTGRAQFLREMGEEQDMQEKTSDAFGPPRLTSSLQLANKHRAAIAEVTCCGDRSPMIHRWCDTVRITGYSLTPAACGINSIFANISTLEAAYTSEDDGSAMLYRYDQPESANVSEPGAEA